MFHAVSYTRGRTWSNAQPYPLLCPNTKFHVVTLAAPLLVAQEAGESPGSALMTAQQSPVTQGQTAGKDGEEGGDDVDDSSLGKTQAEALGAAPPPYGVTPAAARAGVTGQLAVVFNNHRRGPGPEGACRACRTHLNVAVSRNGGSSWRLMGAVEVGPGADVTPL